MDQESLKKLTSDIASLNDKANELKRELDTCKAELEDKKKSLLTLMESQELDSFKNENGNFIVGRRFTVKLPKTPEQWESFWDYLKERGHYDALVTVNSQRLNSWYKQELDRAKEEGDIDWHPPGLEEPSAQVYLQVRKS